MTLVNVFCIGFPSFILALEPNNNRIQGNFIINVLNRAIPGGLTVVLSVVLVTALGIIFNLEPDFVSTLAISVTAFVGLMVIYKTSLPFNIIRIVMFFVCCGGILFGVVWSKGVCEALEIGNFFGFVDMSLIFLIYFVICALIAFMEFFLFNKFRDKFNLNRLYGKIFKKSDLFD